MTSINHTPIFTYLSHVWQVLCNLLPAAGLQEQDDTCESVFDAWGVLGYPLVHLLSPHHAELECHWHRGHCKWIIKVWATLFIRLIDLETPEMLFCKSTPQVSTKTDIFSITCHQREGAHLANVRLLQRRVELYHCHTPFLHTPSMIRVH